MTSNWSYTNGRRVYALMLTRPRCLLTVLRKHRQQVNPTSPRSSSLPDQAHTERWAEEPHFFLFLLTLSAELRYGRGTFSFCSSNEIWDDRTIPYSFIPGLESLTSFVLFCFEFIVVSWVAALLNSRKMWQLRRLYWPQTFLKLYEETFSG